MNVSTWGKKRFAWTVVEVGRGVKDQVIEDIANG
jgi:hypothetical protein